MNSNNDTLTPKRPDGFRAAMEYLGGAYESEIKGYIEQLEAALSATQPAQVAQSETALQKYTRFKVDETEGSPLEKLRAFCAFAMNEQDWFDVEPFFDLVREAQAAQSEQEAELRRSLAAAEATISERNAEIIDLHKRLKAAQGAGEAVASIYITPDGAREVDDWKHDLPVGRNILYTHPTPAQPAPVVPEGWLIRQSEDGSIQVSNQHMGCIVPEVETIDRKVPSEVLHALCKAMLSATPTPPAQAAADTALLDAMQSHRIAVVPEFEGPWDASLYGEDGEPQFIGSGDTPRDAIRAAIASSGRQE